MVASLLCLVIGYPTAYFVARFAGRRKGLFLVLLIAPFWISYMMRMLAWIDLLQTNGYVNKVLTSLHIIAQPVNWLGGHSITVILGLVYGYIPYLILVLYAGLDRIDPSLIEAGRDLGLSRLRTFWRVTLPLSRQPILTGMLITVLPMVGDYFTNQLLSGAPNTSMIGNLIQGQLGTPGLPGPGRDLVPAGADRPDRADDLLRRGHQPLVPGGVMTSVTAPSRTSDTARGRGRRRPDPALAQSVAAPLVPRGLHLALPDLVAGPDRHRGPVLVQQGQVAGHLPGPVDAAGTGATRSTPSSTTRSCKARCSRR